MDRTQNTVPRQVNGNKGEKDTRVTGDSNDLNSSGGPKRTARKSAIPVGQQHTGSAGSETPARKFSLQSLCFRCFRCLRRLTHFVVHLGSNLLTFLLVVMVMGGTVLGSESGRLWLLQKILPEVLAGTDYEIRVEGVASEDLGQWSFERLFLLKNHEILVHAHELTVSVNLSNLLTRRVDVNMVGAEYLHIDVPATPPSETNTESGEPFDWTSLNMESLIPVRVSIVNIETLKVVSEKQEIPDLSVTGSFRLAWNEALLDGSIEISALEKGNGTLSFSGELSEDLVGEIDLRVKEDAAGWIGDQLNVSDTTHLDISLNTEITRDKKQWQVELKHLTLPWRDHFFQASGALTFDKSRLRLETSGFNLLVDGNPQKVEGFFSQEEMNIALNLTDLPVALTSPWQDWFQGGHLSGEVDLSGSLEKPLARAALALTSQYQNFPLEVQTEARITKNSVDLKKTKGRLGQFILGDSSGQLDLESGTMNFVVSQASSPFSYLSLFDVDPVPNLALDLNVSNVTIKGPYQFPEYAGLANTEGTYKGQVFSASAELSGTIEEIQFTTFQLYTAGSKLKASGHLDWEREKLDLDVEADDWPLSSLSLIDIDKPEAIKALVSASGKISGSFDDPVFEGAGFAKGLYTDINEVTEVSLQANLMATQRIVSVVDSLASIKLTGNSPKSRPETTTLRLKGDYLIDKESLKTSVNFDQLPLAALKLFNITIPYQATGKFEGDLIIEGELPVPLVTGNLKGTGQLEGLPFLVNLAGNGRPENFVLKQADIQWGNARLQSKGIYQRGQASFDVKLHELNLADLDAFGWQVMPAEMNFDLNLKGTLEQPEITGKMRLRKGFSNTGASNQLALETDFSLLGEILSVNSHFFKNSLKQGVLSVSLPWKRYWQGYIKGSDFEVNSDFPLALSTEGYLELDWMDDFIDRDIHQFAGNVKVNMISSGTLKSPEVTGVIRLDDGIYKNHITRTILENTDLDILFEGKRLRIGQGSASDGKNGQISAGGYIDWSDFSVGNHGDIAMSVAARNVRLLRRDDVEGQASGELEVLGDFRKLAVSGDINVSPFRVVLDLISDSSIPELDLIVVEEAITSDQSEEEFRIPDISLDISMKASRQAFVVGRGLNAELEGEVRVLGKVEKAEYSGRFGIVRGTFDLFGKKFDLSDGTMLFENDEISLYVEGQYEDASYNYRVVLSGGVSDLDIELTTVPDLPQDEAISRLLFGKSVQAITPFQAVRLAQAIQTLSGKGGGFDPVATTRDILGVDNLTLESQETDQGESGVSVGVGKYVSEKVYVELERTAEPTQPWKGSIEIELTPKLFLEGSADDDLGSASIDLTWKHDY